MSEIEHKTSISYTGFRWEKSGIGLSFHADVAKKRILFIGKETLELSASEVRELVNLLNQMIDLVEDNVNYLKKDIHEPV